MADDPPPIVLVAFDGVEPIDIAGPASVFTRAKRHVPAAPGVIVASARGADVQTNAGFTIGGTVPLASLKGPFDTILVAGGTEAALRAIIAGEELCPWLVHAAKTARRVGSVCTGAFVLAASGLLDGHRATTHWNACTAFQNQFPKVSVAPDAIHVIDGKMCTSAGVTAGIDLALALVEADFGGTVASAIAREMVLFLRRSGGQSQFSAGAMAQHDARDRMQSAVIWIVENPHADLSVPALASRTGMSERHFTRIFTRETGASPARFVLRTRLDHAKHLLETTHLPLKRIAERAGLGSIDSLQRQFRTNLGIAPSDYRARFAYNKPISTAGS
jgi:transcriptional regulator GlxA family with amidase domain